MDITDFKTRRKAINRKAYLKRKERLLNEHAEHDENVNNHVDSDGNVEDVIEPPKVISKTEQKAIYNNRYKQKKKLAEIEQIKAELYDSIKTELYDSIKEEVYDSMKAKLYDTIKAEVLNTIIWHASFDDIIGNLKKQLRIEIYEELKKESYEQVKAEVKKELHDKYMTESKNKLKKFKEFKHK
jgi:hypothetical protein